MFSYIYIIHSYYFTVTDSESVSLLVDFREKKIQDELLSVNQQFDSTL